MAAVFGWGRLRWLRVLLLLGLAAWLAPAWADEKVAVQGVGGEIKDNLDAYLGKLTDEDLKNWRATQLRLRKAARDAMESVGYFEAEFDLQRQGNNVTLTVKPGEPVRVQSLSLKFEGEAGNDVAFSALRESLPLQVGDVFHQGHYEGLKTRVQNLALERGYFDGEWATHKASVNIPKHTVDVELVYAGGDRYRFGQISFLSSEDSLTSLDVREKVLNSLVPFEPGDPYEAAKVIKLNKALLDSRYFGDVRVRADPAKAADKAIPVEILASTANPNNIDVGLGYSTDVGPRISLAWRRPLFNRLGHGIEASTELSQVRRTFDSKYSIPLTHPIDDTLQFLYGVKREEIDDTTVTYNTVLGVQRQIKKETGWQQTQFLRFSRETFEIGDGNETKTDLLLPGLSLSRVRSRGGIDPYWGDRQFYQVQFASPDLLSDADLIQVVAGFRFLRTLADKHQFFLRLDGGTIFSNNFDDVPPTLRFYAGGDQSVRGYDYKSIAPRDEAGKILGGRNLVTGSLEYGYLVRPHWRGAVFVDTGSAFDSLQESFKVGTGFGVRWISPVGAVRLDFAWGVSEPEIPFRIHFSMGPPL